MNYPSGEWKNKIHTILIFQGLPFDRERVYMRRRVLSCWSYKILSILKVELSGDGL